MVETKKIEKVVFSNSWNAPDGVLYYNNIFFEGEQNPYVIGSKSQEPEFLKPGLMLSFTVKDPIKRSIARVQPPAEKSSAGSYDGGIGAMVGNSITNAINLIVAGKAELGQLESIAETICEVSVRLKSKFTK
jgi:hypothetical protein